MITRIFLISIIFSLLSLSMPAAAETESSNSPPIMIEKTFAPVLPLLKMKRLTSQRMMKKRHWSRIQVADHVESCWKIAVKQEKRR